MKTCQQCKTAELPEGSKTRFCRPCYRDRKNEGAKRYRKENPDKHIAYRLLIKDKSDLYKKEHYQANKEKVRVRGQEYRAQNKEKIAESKRKYAQENKEKISAKIKLYYIENKEQIDAKNKAWAKENKDRIVKYKKIYEEDNKDILKQKKAAYREHNKERLSEGQKQHYQNNKEKIKAKTREYALANKDKIKEYCKTYVKERKAADPLFKFKCQVRTMIHLAVKRKSFKKNTKSFSIIGMAAEDFMLYLEQTFVNVYGRTRNSDDVVHIDHKIPMATAKTEEDMIRLCHYSNLQYLLASDNLKKNSKLDYIFGNK
jgi:hypothetical protein